MASDWLSAAAKDGVAIHYMYAAAARGRRENSAETRPTYARQYAIQLRAGNCCSSVGGVSVSPLSSSVCYSRVPVHSTLACLCLHSHVHPHDVRFFCALPKEQTQRHGERSQ